MLEKLKESIDKSQQQLAHVVGKLEDQFEDVSEDVEKLWQQTQPKLHDLKSSLADAAKSLHTQTDEARLQAHLATMDAADQWSYLSETVSELARHAQSKGQHELQHANLQAHLAKMDARDFVNQQGKTIRQDYQQARDKLEQASHKAADSMERSFANIGQGWVGPYV
ncbi:hypothetical protein [Oceanicoccus sp. KOV_DT_Chl]|uniref:hypothetical protein n=1 Tax=Oceanicoccus sp. KOV_DT_Chl TaxID=1904639 RepID=UPI000C79C1C6|nr:hypothetical protein [Oceanicoccus sp. KOV_DT_Chl]